MDLRLRTRPAPGQTERATVVEVAGELDLHSAPQLRAEIGRTLENKPPHIVVDLAGVTFLDSTGVGVLVGALKRAREAEIALDFCNAQPRVRRVFEITGLIGALPLFDTREQALASESGATPMAENGAGAAPSNAQTSVPARFGGAILSAGEAQ